MPKPTQMIQIIIIMPIQFDNSLKNAIAEIIHRVSIAKIDAHYLKFQDTGYCKVLDNSG